MASGFRTERKALDHTHHLSDLALRRNVSPLKGLFKYANKPGMLILAGGMPHADYFPFHSISAEALVHDSFSTSASRSDPSSGSWFWKLFGFGSKKRECTTDISIPKYPTEFGQVNLATSLQYGSATGIVQLQAIFKEFSGKVFQPAYDDWTTMVHTGNTDAWTRCLLVLMNEGDSFLTEEWTYPSAVASAKPYNIKPVSVPIDTYGMRPDKLREILAGWDEAVRGMKRPRVIYTVPVGQNPSGVNVPLSRKKEIYELCVEFDIILVEDDPYYFQQFDTHDAKFGYSRTSNSEPYSVDKYLNSLVPSYLKLDYQGRVIRLDTFSKTIAPGSRLGWFTCCPLFAERLERHGETTTQAPCGFGQSLITQLLLNWKYEGYIRWLHGINAQYQMRRDQFIHSLGESFELTSSSKHATGMWQGCEVIVASEKIVGPMDEKRVFGRRQYFSFVAPAAGMFLWLKVHFKDHPAMARGVDAETLEMQLWTKLAEAGLLIAPGWFFAADSEENHDEARGEGHYRISFSSATPEEMKKATDLFARVLHEFF